MYNAHVYMYVCMCVYCMQFMYIVDACMYVRVRTLCTMYIHMYVCMFIILKYADNCANRKLLKNT